MPHGFISLMPKYIMPVELMFCWHNEFCGSSSGLYSLAPFPGWMVHETRDWGYLPLQTKPQRGPQSGMRWNRAQQEMGWEEGRLGLGNGRFWCMSSSTTDASVSWPIINSQQDKRGLILMMRVPQGGLNMLLGKFEHFQRVTSEWRTFWQYLFQKSFILLKQLLCHMLLNAPDSFSSKEWILNVVVSHQGECESLGMHSGNHTPK